MHARDATRGGERRRLQLQLADLVVGERFVEPALDALIRLAPHDPRRAPDLVALDALQLDRARLLQRGSVRQRKVPVRAHQDDRDVPQVVEVGP